MTTRTTAAAAYEVVRVAPPGGETYAYRLPVPRGWAYGGSVGRALELDTIPRPLGTFVPPDRSASIVVAVTPLPIEVRVEEWLAADLGRAGWQVAEMGWHRVAGAPKLAVLARREGYVRAIAAMPDGGRLYAVYVQAPAARVAEVGDRLWWSAMAFTPCRPGGPGRLEARQRVDVGAFCFEAPISWDAGTPAGAPPASRAQLVLRHPAGAERSRLTVRIDPPTSSTPSLDERRAATLARLGRGGLTLARQLDPPATPWRGVPRDWELRSVAARNKTGDVVDLLIVHGNRDGAGIEVLAVGSRATTRSWMRTTRAVELACETLAPAMTVGTGARRR